MDNEDIAKRIGNNIRTSRLSLGITQNVLAGKSKIATTQLSAYENGHKMIGLTSLAAIAKALGKSLDELYFGDTSKKPIVSSENKEELTINCFATLVDLGVIQLVPPLAYSDYSENETSTLKFVGNESLFKDLCNKLEDFNESLADYPDPEKVKENILAVAVKRLIRYNAD